MATAPKLIPPKNGRHVTSTQQEGVFEIVFVNALTQTANIRLVDGFGIGDKYARGALLGLALTHPILGRGVDWRCRGHISVGATQACLESISNEAQGAARRRCRSPDNGCVIGFKLR